MKRNYLRPFLVHSCFNQSREYVVWKQLRRPKECKCRLLMSREETRELVERGMLAEMIVDWKWDSEGVGHPVTVDNMFVHTGRAVKTPRTQTIEKADIERAYVFDYPEDQARIEAYGELILEARLDMFGDLTKELMAAKVESDRAGEVKGQSGKLYVQKLQEYVDGLKNEMALNDTYEGECLFNMFGPDQRTCPGR